MAALVLSGGYFVLETFSTITIPAIMPIRNTTIDSMRPPFQGNVPPSFAPAQRQYTLYHCTLSRSGAQGLPVLLGHKGNARQAVRVPRSVVTDAVPAHCHNRSGFGCMWINRRRIEPRDYVIVRFRTVQLPPLHADFSSSFSLWRCALSNPAPEARAPDIGSTAVCLVRL